MSHPEITWNHVQVAFQKIWGYEDFRPPQAEIIRSLLAQQDALIVMPTGGGKSICFQLPALLQKGLTLVVSPLVALMENQVQELRDRFVNAKGVHNLSAALLHSELPPHQRRMTLQLLERQQLRLLYLSPETLLSAPVWERLCQPHLKINRLILDEAHCLVQWGETFRPAYRRLGAVRPALLKSKPKGTQIAIAAFTATANPVQAQIIQQVLQLQQAVIYRQNPYRQNLHLKVQTVWTPRGRRQQLLNSIRVKPGQGGLVYVRSRRDSENLAQWLSQLGYATASYHAGLSPDERRSIEASWLSGNIAFVICTSAFGMGINKNGVRWVIHFHAPALLSEYVQEIGRAGRDGEQSIALTLVSEPTGWLDPEDKQRQQFFENQERQHRQMVQELINQIPVQGDVGTVTRQFKYGAIALSLLHSTGQLEWLDPFHYVIKRSTAPQALTHDRATQDMIWYLKTNGCRWKFILEAFGFSQNAKALEGGCGHCDRCLPRQ